MAEQISDIIFVNKLRLALIYAIYISFLDEFCPKKIVLYQIDAVFGKVSVCRLHIFMTLLCFLGGWGGALSKLAAIWVDW